MRLASLVTVGAAAAVVILPLGGHAQQVTDDRAQVRAAALDYIEGFYEGDSTRLVRSVDPGVHKFGYFIPRNTTQYAGEAMSFAEMMAYANSVKKSGRKQPATAPKGVEIYDVLDQTASAKVTAWWGTDYLLLAKIGGQWKITNIVWQSPPPSR